MLPRLFKRVYHYTVYAIGIIVLSAAVIVTLIRLFLPDIGIYRGEVEAWVSHYMGYPVVIHSLDASWEGWVPYLRLGDIDLLNRAGTQAITHFDSARIRIAPVATLMNRRIIPKQLTVNGFELAIARLSNGAIYIEGINISDPQINQLGDNELANWLFKQEQIKIENASIEWLDVKHEQKPVLLSNVTLALRSDSGRLQAEGSATLPEFYGENMDFAFDARGDLLSSEWSGELYLAGHDINPDNWYRDYRPLNLDISGGSANIKVWSTWKMAKLSRLEGELQYNNFNTSAGDSKLHVQELAYRFLGKRLGKDGWQFQLDLKHLLTDNGDWPKTNLMVSATRTGDNKDYRYSAAFDYLKLDDLNPFIRNLTFLPDTVKDKLAGISIQGELNHGKLIYNPDNEPAKRLRFETNFKSLNLNAVSGIQLPSLLNLSGHLYGGLQQGVIMLDANDARLDLDLLEAKSLHLKQLSGRVSWHKMQDEWKLDTDKLHLQGDGLSVTVSGSVAKSSDNDSAFMDIIATLGESDLEKIPHYLPRTPRFKLRDWMKRSVTGGKLSSASVIFRGYIADFPFDEHEGRFELIADTTKATLDYSAYWPPVDNIDAEIIIDGRRMQAGFGAGNIFSASIHSAKAGIENILAKHKTVTLNGRIRGSAKDLSLFINQSPLQKDPGLNEFNRALQGGEFVMDLDMRIPLKQPGRKPDVKGNIELSDATLKSRLKNLQLDNVWGNIGFTHDSVNSAAMDATFFDKPVKLLISGSKLKPDNPATIRIHGMADHDFVADRLIEHFPAMKSMEYYLRNRMSGESEWYLTLKNLPGEKENTIVKRLIIGSDLVGMKIDMPAPVGKPDYRSRPIKISSYLGSEQPRNIQITYADILHAELLLDADKKLNTINMQCGEGQPVFNNDPGLHINGRVDELVAADWWDAIKPGGINENRPPSAVIRAGVNIDLQVASLDLLNFHFPDIGLSIHRPEQYWNFNLRGDSISGDIRIPVDRKNNNLISFQLDKLELKQDKQQADSDPDDPLRPENIPAIRGKVQEFIYNDINLGNMQLRTSPVSNGLAIEQLTFEKPALSIKSQGNWAGTMPADTSRFTVDLHADDMETMLHTFGYKQTPVKKGKTDLHLQAEWQGSPMDFSLEKMNGTLNMRISKGQMLNIDPAAGRLFGLFSLQTLPRRLTLDFSDIFGKGLAFDEIQGNFNIDGGNAYTNDLYMRGPSADIAITGRTGLSDQDYDQVVTVTPQLSNNLPVAGVLLGPVGIGVGAVYYLAGKMFHSLHENIDKLLRYQYTITGTWNQPVVEKIKTKGKSSS